MTIDCDPDGAESTQCRYSAGPVSERGFITFVRRAAHHTAVNNDTVSVDGDRYLLTESGWRDQHGDAVTLTDVVQTATATGDRAIAETVLRLHRQRTATAIVAGHQHADVLFDDYARATDLLDVAAAADLIRVGQPTLRKYNAARPGPPHLPPPTLSLGGSPLWARHTLEDWLATRPGRGRRGHDRHS